jgi:hypothetical protein
MALPRGQTVKGANEERAKIEADLQPEQQLSSQQLQQVYQPPQNVLQQQLQKSQLTLPKSSSSELSFDSLGPPVPNNPMPFGGYTPAITLQSQRPHLPTNSSGSGGSMSTMAAGFSSCIVIDTSPPIRNHQQA